jgi:hypothetical protein
MSVNVQQDQDAVTGEDEPPIDRSNKVYDFISVLILMCMIFL